MKNLKNLFIGVLFLFMLSSCSKDNLAAKKLEGMWNITSFTNNGTQLLITNTKMETTFSDVNGNVGTYNTKAYAFNILLTDVSGQFTVADDGTSLTLKEDGSSSPGTGTINKLTNSELKVTYVDFNGNTIVFEGEK